MLCFLLLLLSGLLLQPPTRPHLLQACLEECTALDLHAELSFVFFELFLEPQLMQFALFLESQLMHFAPLCEHQFIQLTLHAHQQFVQSVLSLVVGAQITQLLLHTCIAVAQLVPVAQRLQLSVVLFVVAVAGIAAPVAATHVLLYFVRCYHCNCSLSIL
jgi:hypothetical protein